MNWIKSMISIGVVALMIVLSSCGDDPEFSTVDLNFTLTYEDQPLVAFDELDYALDFKVLFTKYSLFMSDITLKSTEGDHTLSNVEFVDLLTGVNDVPSAEAGKTLTFMQVPTRKYDGISFNIGVPTDVNTTDPASYDASSPLSNNGEYWVGWSSYIFHKIEGKMDSAGDGTFADGVALHIGSDQAFRSFDINANIEIDEDSESIKLEFDLNDILNINGAYFDFRETPQVHHLGVLPAVLPILDNTDSGISVTVE